MWEMATWIEEICGSNVDKQYMFIMSVFIKIVISSYMIIHHSNPDRMKCMLGIKRFESGLMLSLGLNLVKDLSLINIFFKM